MPEWYEGLPEKFRSDPNITKFKTQEAQIESHLELSKRIGNSIELPADKTVDTLRPVLRKLGAHEKAEDYKLPDTDIGRTFGTVFADAGILPHQASVLVGAIDRLSDRLKPAVDGEIDKAIASRQSKALADADAMLAKEWGDKAAERMEKIKRFEDEFKDSSEHRIYSAALKADPKTAREYAFSTFEAHTEPAHRGPTGLAPATGNDARALLDKFRAEALKAKQEGKPHWWNSSTAQQEQYKIDLYQKAMSKSA